MLRSLSGLLFLCSVQRPQSKILSLKPRGGQSIFSFACFAYCQMTYFAHFCFGGSDNFLFKLIFKQKMACNVGNVGLQPVIDDLCFVPIVLS